MTAADFDRVLAEYAHDREQLIAVLNAAEAERAAADRAARYAVVQQYGHLPDKQVSTHRWAWLAEWRARRAARRDTAAASRAHYTVRRAAQ